MKGQIAMLPNTSIEPLYAVSSRVRVNAVTETMHGAVVTVIANDGDWSHQYCVRTDLDEMGQFAEYQLEEVDETYLDI